MLSKTFLQFGSDLDAASVPKPLELRAGPLTALFEPNIGFLRYVRLGDFEVIRAIYGAVRDENWATIPSEIRGLKTDIQKDAFRIEFDVICRNATVDYQWRATISGDASGKVAFTFDGESRSDFKRKRIGLCVLHPIQECAGKSCTVQHAGGSEEKGTFPRGIAPHQPFFDIHRLAYEIGATGVTAEIQFEGDVFEMEDQRNWSDASFKTYSTPQERPTPVQVKPGDKVLQSVTLRLKGYSKPVLPVVLGRGPQISISTTPVLQLPPLGLQMARSGERLTEGGLERLKVLRLSHLRVNIDLREPDWTAFENAAHGAESIGAGLHVALTLGDKLELEAARNVFASAKAKILLFLLFHSGQTVPSEAWVRDAQGALKEFGALTAAGTREFFVDVNRQRPGLDFPAYLCYSVNPQVHQTDLRTLVENLPAQASAAESAHEFSSRPVVVSPITLKRAGKPGSPPNNEPSAFPADADIRQLSLLGAGWTLGSIAKLASTANVHSLTYFETTGLHGVMSSSDTPLLPGELTGAVFPLYHVLADIGEFPGRQFYPTHSTHPLSVEALTLFDGRSRKRLIVASYSHEPSEVKIKTGTCKAEVRYLDDSNVLDAMKSPEPFRKRPGAMVDSVSGKIELRLLPFALARVDIQ